MILAQGKDLTAIPGPSIMPDRVLNAMHRPAPNIYGEDLINMTDTVYTDLSRVARTSAPAVIYIGNGHASWEAVLANMFNPGDHVLMLSTGRFVHMWAAMARQMGINVEIMEFGFHAAVDPNQVEERLASDITGTIRAVLTTQTDTASSVRNNIPDIAKAIEESGHPALFMVDCVASLACEPFEMDDWGVDVMLSACQKGLMTPPGLAFTWAGPRAVKEAIECKSSWWDWKPRIDPEIFYQRFCGTPPTHHLYGLREALTMILDEVGLENTWERHRRFAEAIWAAVDAWGGGLRLNITDPADRSTAVTAIHTGQGDGQRLREWCEANAGLSLGVGIVGPEGDPNSVFRIGHMGHLDPPMVLGALATIETGLAALHIPHHSGGVSAAAAVLAGSAAD